ncbi:MAG: lysylphosphatidylglycerol synthase domain-containing protein [Pirellulales bacterium]
MAQQLSSPRHSLIWALRIAVLVLVCLGVGGTARNALAELSQQQWHVQPGWLVASGVLYAVGLVPMAWFWHRALAALGQPAPWPASLRAYFFGHLGKYVPGKALAIILRVAAVRKWVASTRVAIVCSLLETLTMMAVGAFLAAALSVVVLHLEPALAALALAIALVVGLPTLPPVARRLARVGVDRLKQQDELNLPAPIPANANASLHGINWRLLATGWLAACVCWLLLGLSLWATLRAMGLDRLDPIADLPLLIAAVSFAVVAGFASMLPGGLVVRDALLMQLLTPSCGAANALVAAVLMRLVWLVSELVVCVILYVAAKIR